MALDTAKGEMLVAFLLPPDAAAAAADDDAAASIWRAAYVDGVCPGAAVGIGLFPCLSGHGGAKVRDNAGLDAARPLRLAPPTSEFRPAGIKRPLHAARRQTDVKSGAVPPYIGGICAGRRDRAPHLLLN